MSKIAMERSPWAALCTPLSCAALLTLVACGGDGKDGVDGAQGERGAVGEAGPAGNDGEPGTQGEAGERGPMGEAGAMGAAGQPGAVGMTGQAGPDGDDGMEGPKGDPGAMGPSGSPGFERATFYVSNNGTSNVGTVDRVLESFAKTGSFMVGNNEGLAFGTGGELIQAGDTTAGASVRTFCAAETRADGDMFDPARDRVLTHAGLVNPQGFALAEKAGLLIVANFNATNLLVFGSSAAGDTAPVATTTLPANPWDVAYDEVNDRLFVAMTNGDVGVFDKYVGTNFVGPAARVITPAKAGVKISVNLHGVVYDAWGDRLILSDVGSAAVTTDGALFVIDDASSASGLVNVSRDIAGPTTRLGNPVDIVLTGTDLRVAEKAQDVLLVFSDIFHGASGDVAPTHTMSSTKPEALVEYHALDTRLLDVSDIDMPGQVIPFIGIVGNPVAGTGSIAKLASVLGAPVNTFDPARSVESLVYGLDGDAYITFDDGSNTNGGILVAGRAATTRASAATSATRDRTITGAATGLVSPKGLDISTRSGYLFIAENNATTPAVLMFSTCAAGNVAPTATLTLGGGRPWDVDFDEASGRLYVALTNGDVAVFDQVLQDFGAGGPDRVFTPAVGGVKVSINLHGIDYDPATDMLLLSDVGSAAVATDGQLFAVPNAARASGLTNVAIAIAGPTTLLGNPVDIAYDGRNLYVAEKSNSRILRYDNFLDSAGGDLAAQRSTPFTAPESVALQPWYVGSISRED